MDLVGADAHTDGLAGRAGAGGMDEPLAALALHKRLEGGSFELPTFNPDTGNYEVSYQILSFILNGEVRATAKTL